MFKRLTPYRRDFTVGVLSNLTTAALLAGGGVVLVALAKWLQGLTELARGVLWGSAGSLLLLAVLVLIIHFLLRRQARKEETPKEPVEQPKTEPHVPNEVIEQFRTFHHYLARAVQWAIDFLDAGICGSSDAATDELKACLGSLIREQLLPVCRDRKEHLDSLVSSGDWTGAKLNEAIICARVILNGDYGRLTGWINRVGPLILGERFELSPGYYELRHRHWEMLVEAKRIRIHSQLCGIVPTLDIEQFVSGLVRQGSTPYLGPMSAQELWAHVRSEGSHEFIHREWSISGTIVGREEYGRSLRLICATGNGYAITLDDVNALDPDSDLEPGTNIDARGTIWKITNNDGIWLSQTKVAPAQTTQQSLQPNPPHSTAGSSKLQFRIVPPDRGSGEGVNFAPIFERADTDNEWTSIGGHFGNLEVVNGDTSDVEVRRVWFVVRDVSTGKEIEPLKKDKEEDLKPYDGSTGRRVPARRSRSFAFTFDYHYPQRIEKTSHNLSFDLCLEVTGFPVVSAAIPGEYFSS